MYPVQYFLKNKYMIKDSVRNIVEIIKKAWCCMMFYFLLLLNLFP